MSNANVLAHGVDAKYFAKLETTFDTVSAFVAGDAVDLQDLKIDPTLDQRPVKSHRGSASEQAMVAGRKGGKWSAVAYLSPNAAGTAPDIGPLFEAAFGDENVVGGTSVSYVLSDSLMPTLQLARIVGEASYEVINGAIVEQLDIENASGGEPKVTFSGTFSSYGYAFGGDTTGVEAAGQSVISVAAAHKGNWAPNAVVVFGSENNAGAGYTITAVDNTAGSITVSPVLGVEVASGAAIKPFSLTPTYGAGTPIEGVDSNLTVDSVATGFIGAKISVKNGLHLRDKEVSTNRASGVARGKREVTGELQFYFLDKVTGPIMGRAWDGTTRALALRIGPNTAAKRLIVTIPKAYFEVAGLDLPEAEEATAACKFRALQNSASADEINISFT
jgi:hypothetical protein